MEKMISKKPIMEESAIPFYYQVKEDLKRRIANAEFTVGSQMLSEHELMAEYAVSRITVIRAVSELAKEGLLYRRRGKGTFVAKPAMKITSQDIVGLIMPTTGHLYGPLATGIIRGLTEHQYFCLTVEPASVNEKDKTYEKVASLISRDPAILVIDGSCEFPFDEGTCRFPRDPLEDYRGRIIFVDRCEIDKKYPASYVLSDYFEGGRIMAEHFLSVGHTQILYYSSPVKPEQRSRLVQLEGARQAFRDRNLPEENLLFCSTTISDGELDETLKGLGKPLAIFSSGDAGAKRLYAAAHRLGLRIPQDISIIGYYNTPWCEMFDPHLSSVSIREQDIADQVVETILTGTDRKVLMKPKLILRNSTLNR